MSVSAEQSLIWISGASEGIGRSLARMVPWAGARVIGISRRAPEGIEHLQADLADPASWPVVEASFRSEAARFSGDRIVFVHAAGTVEPVGFAGEVDSSAYSRNVILNSAAPQVLGHMFIRAVKDIDAQRYLVHLTSGAARSVYQGWSSYGAAKAAVDQWVRDAGAEQARRGGVRVLSVAPGTVDTAMQARLRATEEKDFPQRQKFLDLHARGKLSDPDEVAAQMWSLFGRNLDNGSVIDLRDL